jgi:RNA polymerase sigma-70 factor, Bacteroides expansion family 1
MVIICCYMAIRFFNTFLWPRNLSKFALFPACMKSLREFRDEELIPLLIKGSREAFECIYKRYWGILYSQALRLLRDEDDAKDVVQDLFVALYANERKIQPDTRIATYLYVALRHRVINRIQQRKVRSDYLDTLSNYPEPQGETIISNITEKEIKQVMDDEIDRMPPKMQQAFELSRKEYLSNREIAQQLDIQESTVKSHVNNALKLIRIRLKGFTGLFSFLLLLVRNLF